MLIAMYIAKQTMSTISCYFKYLVSLLFALSHTKIISKITCLPSPS